MHLTVFIQQLAYITGRIESILPISWAVALRFVAPCLDCRGFMLDKILSSFQKYCIFWFTVLRRVVLQASRNLSWGTAYEQRIRCEYPRHRGFELLGARGALPNRNRKTGLSEVSIDNRCRPQ